MSIFSSGGSVSITVAVVGHPHVRYQMGTMASLPVVLCIAVKQMFSLSYVFIAVKQCFPFIIHLLQLSNVFTGKYVNFFSKTFTPHKNYVKKILKTFII